MGSICCHSKILPALFCFLKSQVCPSLMTHDVHGVSCLHCPSVHLLVCTLATSRQQNGRRKREGSSHKRKIKMCSQGCLHGVLIGISTRMSTDTCSGIQVLLKPSLSYWLLICRLHHPSPPSPSWLKIIQRRVIKAKENECWLWERQCRKIAQDLPF